MRRTYTVHGRKVRACSAGCADCFREDRKHGLIYGPNAVRYEDGTVRLMDREPWSLETLCCVYCGADTDRADGAASKRKVHDARQSL